MPVFGSQNFGSGGVSAYTVDNSCMFDYASGSYLSRTPGLAGNRKTWTMSVWLKMTRLASSTGGGIYFWDAGTTQFGWSDSNDNLYLIAGSTLKRTTGVARDTTGWFHICIVADTPQSTASERFKVYINGAIPTLTTDTAPAQDFEFEVNNTVAQNIGAEGSNYWDGYMAEFHLIDGTAKAVGDFGETNDEGVWVPKKYTGGGYGTCGFHLDFADSADLGDDNSGQGNDFSLTNIAAAHQSSDSPTNNHCILNVLDPITSSVELTEGAKQVKFTGGDQDSVLGTIFQSKGKWYWEMKYVTAGGGGNWGITRKDFNVSSDFGSTAGSYAFRSGGDKINSNSAAGYGSAWSADDIIQCAWDADNGKVFFGINNTWQASGDPAAGSNPAYSSIGTTVVDGGGLGPGASSEGNTVYLFRFTEAECSYDPPTGFKHLNTANIAEPAITDPSAYFQAAIYSGNSSTQTITFDGNSDMQPDFIWGKSRSNSDAHVIQEAATGTGTATFISRTNSDAVTDAVTAFNSDGFALGDGSELADGTINTSGRTYVSLNWKANGSGASNTTGTINTTKTSASATAGVSINTYTGNGTDQATYGHGLGVTPTFSWTFSLTSADHRTSSTWVAGDTAFSKQVGIDAVGDAFGDSDAGLGKVEGGSSTVITLGQDPGVNGNTVTYMSLVFAEVEGFSKFGSFEGNQNANGPFLYCGFQPEFVLIKANRGGEPWTMFDRKRSTFNPADDYLMPSNSDAEASSSSISIDFLCTGCKVRRTDSRVNRSGHDIIFAAFAKHPLGGEEVAPATAVL